jgi:peptide/nickel transport system permease protein
MMSENRPGLTIQAWSVAVPALMIVALTVGTNLLADSIARSRGTTIEKELIAR